VRNKRGLLAYYQWMLPELSGGGGGDLLNQWRITFSGGRCYTLRCIHHATHHLQHRSDYHYGNQKIHQIGDVDADAGRLLSKDRRGLLRPNVRHVEID